LITIFKTVDSILLFGTGKMDKKAVKAKLKEENYVLADLLNP